MNLTQTQGVRQMKNLITCVYPLPLNNVN